MRAMGAKGNPSGDAATAAGRMQTNMKEQLAWLENVRVVSLCVYVYLVLPYCVGCELTMESNCL